MLDISKLIALIFYSNNNIKFQQIKTTLVEVTSQFDSDDMMLFEHNMVQGSGPATALIANHVHEFYNSKELAIKIKETFKEMGTMDFHCPKYMFVICDYIDDHLRSSYNRIVKINEALDYNIQINFIICNEHLDISIPYLHINDINAISTFILDKFNELDND